MNEKERMVANIYKEPEFFVELTWPKKNFPFSIVKRLPFADSRNYSNDEDMSWANFKCKDFDDIQKFSDRMRKKGFSARGFVLKSVQVYFDHECISCAE